MLGSDDMRNLFFWALALLTFPVTAAERRFDFSDVGENQTPPGFRSTVAGQGKPGDWKVILDEVPSLLPPLNARRPPSPRRRCWLNSPRTQRTNTSRC